jgi:hypothetical protein
LIINSFSGSEFMQGLKFFFLILLLISNFAKADIIELAPGLTINTNHFILKMASCGPGIPGDACIIQCYNINNQTTDLYYTCNLQAKATFIEQINLTGGSVLYTGNTLTATDYRSAVVYPYQTVSVCFNYGKEVVSTPAQPNSLWVFQSSTITANDGTNPTCIGGTEGPVTGTEASSFN